MSRLFSITLRASGIARHRTEPGWRAAVLDERTSRHAFRLRGVRKAAAKERQPQRAERAMDEERAEAFFPLLDCSLPLAADRAGKPPTLSSLADEKRVGSLLRSTAPRDPVRATTTAADCARDARAASQ
jgi:hypothetical protein